MEHRHVSFADRPATLRLAVIAGLGMAGMLHAHAAAAPSAPPVMGDPIIVRPPPTEAERHKELRDFTREVIRPPRMNHPVAKFFYPVCVTVLGLAPEDAAVVADRIRENATALGVGADPKPDCTPTIRVAFMAPAAGPAAGWLTADSPQLAHLASYQRERVLAERGPVRAWNRVVVRDFNGQPLRLADARVIGGMDMGPVWVDPYSATDPIMTTEITAAAVLIARDAADGLTLGQLADYATMRTLLGTGAPEGDTPAPTILTLFDDPQSPPGLTDFDRALVRELYDASRNAKPRRVFNDIARAATAAERSDRRDD